MMTLHSIANKKTWDHCQAQDMPFLSSFKTQASSELWSRGKDGPSPWKRSYLGLEELLSCRAPPSADPTCQSTQLKNRSWIKKLTMHTEVPAMCSSQTLCLLIHAMFTAILCSKPYYPSLTCEEMRPQIAGRVT